MARVSQQVNTGQLDLGEIVDPADLEANLAENAIPSDFATVGAANYGEFLEKRRHLMASKIRNYYENL